MRQRSRRLSCLIGGFQRIKPTTVVSRKAEKTVDAAMAMAEKYGRAQSRAFDLQVFYATLAKAGGPRFLRNN